MTMTSEISPRILSCGVTPAKNIMMTTHPPPTYTMRVTAINTNDATMRQVVEGIQIQQISPDVIINNRSEWTAGGGIVGAALTRM